MEGNVVEGGGSSPAEAAACALATSLERGSVSLDDAAAALRVFPTASTVSIALNARGGVLVSSGNLVKEGPLTLALLAPDRSAVGACINSGGALLIRSSDRNARGARVYYDVDDLEQQYSCRSFLLIPLSAARPTPADAPADVHNYWIVGCLTLGFPDTYPRHDPLEFPATIAAVVMSLGEKLPAASRTLLADMRFLLQPVPQSMAAMAAIAESTEGSLSGTSPSSGTAQSITTSPASSGPRGDAEGEVETASDPADAGPSATIDTQTEQSEGLEVEDVLSALHLPDTPKEGQELRTNQYRRRSSDNSRGDVPEVIEIPRHSSN